MLTSLKLRLPHALEKAGEPKPVASLRQGLTLAAVAVWQCGSVQGCRSARGWRLRHHWCATHRHSHGTELHETAGAPPTTCPPTYRTAVSNWTCIMGHGKTTMY